MAKQQRHLFVSYRCKEISQKSSTPIKVHDKNFNQYYILNTYITALILIINHSFYTLISF